MASRVKTTGGGKYPADAPKERNEFQDEDLEVVRQQFEEFMDTSRSARGLAEKCRNYKDGNQWTEGERTTLRKRKQPCITDNKIQDKHDTLMGIEKQMRTDPRAFPRTPGDDDAADAATDALRYIADCNDFNRNGRKPATDNLIVEGVCYGHVIVEKQKGQYVKVSMEHIRWDRGYVDIHALRDDFDDKTYCGYFRWMDDDVAKREFKGREEAINSACASGGASVANVGESADDKPRYVMTVRKRKRVQVFKHYWLKDGVWHEGCWCSGGWLEPLKPCVYKDEYGEPQCCLEVQALYRDGDGNAYGAVQRWLDLQDAHNKRHSKMLHLLNAKRIIVQKGLATDDEGSLKKIREEVHNPDGVLEVNGDISQLRVEDNIRESQGQWQLLQYTDSMLSVTGPNDALQGNSGSNSGRAKQLDQQAGSLMVSPIFEALDSWELRMYKQAWYRVKQYWTAPMWVRITDDEQKPKFVGLNQPVTQGEEQAERLKGADMPVEEKQALIQQIAADPMAQQPAMENGKPRTRNSVAEMDVDIIIDRSQDTVNIQQEQFERLATLAESRPEVPFEVLVDMSQLRSEIKKRIRDKLSGADNPQAAEQQKAAMERAMAAEDATVRSTMAEAALKEAQAAKTMAEAQTPPQDLLAQKQSDTQMQLQLAQAQSAEKVQLAQAQLEVDLAIQQIKAQSAERIAAADRRAKAAEAMAVAAQTADIKRESDYVSGAVQIIVAKMSADTAAAQSANDESVARDQSATQSAVQTSEISALAQSLKEMIQAQLAPKRFDFELDDEGMVVGATQQVDSQAVQ